MNAAVSPVPLDSVTVRYAVSQTYNGSPYSGGLTLSGIKKFERRFINTKDHISKLNDSCETYYLTRDISLGYSQWKPIADFHGTLFGQDHKIYGLYIYTEAVGNFGLFAINHGVINNLKIEGSVSVYNSDGSSGGAWTNLGLLAGINYGYLDYCTSNSSIATTSVTYNSNTGYTHSGFKVATNRDNSSVGGLVGKIINISIIASIILTFGDEEMLAVLLELSVMVVTCGAARIMGILGYLWATNNRSVGGIVGYMNGEDCF